MCVKIRALLSDTLIVRYFYRSSKNFYFSCKLVSLQIFFARKNHREFFTVKKIVVVVLIEGKSKKATPKHAAILSRWASPIFFASFLSDCQNITVKNATKPQNTALKKIVDRRKRIDYTMPIINQKLFAAALAAAERKVVKVKVYKLFRLGKDGKLYPLYVNATEAVPVGVWIKAKSGQMTANGKVKSKLGQLAFRPGWHSSDVPVALHIGEKANKTDKAPSYRADWQVWAECEVRGRDLQSLADKQGKQARDKCLKSIESLRGGFYRYRTNPNMYGTWIISAEIKVIKTLTDTEVWAINAKTGVHDLPRRK